MKHSSLAQDRVTKLACICIFFIGAYFRFSGLYESIWSSAYDETRDTIVASHFIKYGEFLTRGPNVTTPYLLNPPTYYYFISGLLWIGGSLWGAKVMWACMLTMTIVLAYIVGCRVWDRKLGIISASLVAVHPTYIIPMQLISQTMLLPILLFLVLIFLFQRKQTITSLSLSISFLLLGLHSHYSIFILLPFVGMWWMMLYVSFVKTHVGILKWKCIIPAVVGVVGVGVWILLSYQSFPLDQVAILKIGNTQLLTQYVAQLNIAISEYLYVLFYWYMQPKSIGLAVLGIGFISLGVWSLYLARRATSQTIGSLCVLVGLNIVPFILAGKYTNTIFTAYVLAVLPIGVFTIAFILRALMHKFPYIGISVLLIVLGFYTRMTVWELTNRSGISYYQLNRQIAVAINNDNARLTYPDTNMYPFTIRFVVADEPTYLNEWQSGGIWFHLESITKKKLVVLKETDADFQSIEQNPSYTYIVCDARSATDKRTEANGCETTKETLQHTYKQVFELIYQKYPYWVWRMYGSVQGV